MKVAIMQPYVFPYIGYFQLVNAADIFVFYDDVNFTRRGWINRNKLLVNSAPSRFTIPCIAASQNKLINEIEVDKHDKRFKNILKTIDLAYSKAPNFKTIRSLVEDVLTENSSLSMLARQSIELVSKYLGIKSKFLVSSESFGNTKGLNAADRIIAITKIIGSNNYINPIGGIGIYSKQYFDERGVKLNFIEPHLSPYNQHTSEFIPSLSIIDALMFNSVKEIQELLDDYKLI